MKHSNTAIPTEFNGNKVPLELEPSIEHRKSRLGDQSLYCISIYRET